MLKIQGKPETASKTFRLPINVVRKLERVACKNNLSQNQLAIQYLTYALHEIDTASKEKNDKN